MIRDTHTRAMGAGVGRDSVEPLQNSKFLDSGLKQAKIGS